MQLHQDYITLAPPKLRTFEPVLPAPYATHPAASRGRLVKEAESTLRTPFQRDRDRIIHCSAFRRLRNKMQVFIESEGDYFRTRLTHSLEVAQIARTIARTLDVDEDLAEALALAHDLGHTCFGHAGEAALDESMKDFGGFDHNEQTFRILTALEKRYALFDGLNLCWETLEGIAKHNGPLLPEKGKELPPGFAGFCRKFDLELEDHAGIEAQIASLSDDIAYNTHDFDDGFRAGFFTLEEMAELPIFSALVRQSLQRYPGIETFRLVHEIVRQAIGLLIEDLLAQTRHNLERQRPQSAAGIRAAGQPMVAFSPPVFLALQGLREFLAARMYRHEKVNEMVVRGQVMVKKLFGRYMDDPARLPPSWRALVDMDKGHAIKKARHVADYVAGMTDRFAEQEYQRLFGNEV